MKTELPTATVLTLRVKTFRNAGLEARWSKHNGRPCMAVRNPSAKLTHQRLKWWVITNQMWEAMKQDGVLMGFENSTLLGDVFSI